MALSPPEWNALILKAEGGDTRELYEAIRLGAEALLQPREEWEGSWSTSEMLDKLYPVRLCGADFIVRRKKYMYRCLANLARTVMRPYVTLAENRKARKVFGHAVKTAWRWHGPIKGCCPTCKRPYQ